MGSDFKHRLLPPSKQKSVRMDYKEKREGGSKRWDRRQQREGERSVHNTRVRTNEQEMKMQGESVGVTQTVSVSDGIAVIVIVS